MPHPIGQKGQLVKRSLGPKSQVPDPKSQIPGPRSQILNPESQVPDSKSPPTIFVWYGLERYGTVWYGMPDQTRCAQRVLKIVIFGIFGHWDALGIAPRGYSCPQKWLGLVF